MTPPTPSDAIRRVGILVFEGVKLLDLAGPAEVFIEAATGYEVAFVSPDGHDVLSSVGARVAVQGPAAQAGRFDTVLVPGSDLAPRAFVTPEVLAAADLLAGNARRLVSICSGAFVLAELGLLDGRRATTHWKHTDDLAERFPEVHVEPDSLWVRDGNVYTSAGAAAGIDLALALVHDDLGAEAARRVAQTLLVPGQRAGGESQLPASATGPTPSSALLRSLLDLVHSDPSRAYGVRDLAVLVNVSPRSLTRLFRAELQTTPAEYLAGVRFGLARQKLAAGCSVTDAASEAGYGSSESMRRAFVEQLGIPPRTYQQRLASAG